MNKVKWALHTALAMGLLAGWPSLAGAAQPEKTPTIRVAVDAVDLSDTRAELPVVVEAELDRLLAEHEELPPGVFAAEDRSVLIELRPGPIPGGDDVLIRAVVRLDGEVLADSATQTCLACSDEKVAQKALMLLEPLLPELPAPAMPEPPAPTLAADAPPEPIEPTARPAPARRLVIPGATLMGAGVLGLGVGIGLIVANEQVVSAPDALDLEVVKYREPGVAVAVLGGVAALTGAALLGLSVRGRNRRPVVFSSKVGIDGGGFILHGSF